LWLYAFTGRPILRYVYVFIPFSYHIIAFIFWKANEENPLFIDKIFRYAIAVFVLVLLIIAGIRFFVDVPLIWVILLGTILTGFIAFYNRIRINKIWIFCLGIVLIRIVYAVLFIPMQERLIKINYRAVASELVANAKNENIILWTEPQSFPVGIDVDYIKWKFDSVYIPPRFKNYMLPYYIYHQSGHTVKYDTAIKANNVYLSTEDRLKEKKINSLWSWDDMRQNIKYVLFRSSEKETDLLNSNSLTNSVPVN
jgi:hypothetical protein